MTLHRRPTSRWALWLFAAALILKAAMPMLATASAQSQGKALVEVCTVYGMSMVSADGDPAAAAGEPHAPLPDDTTAHLDHDCALTALAALATAEAPPALPVRSAQPAATAGWAVPDARPGHDAAAAWVAGRKQGPPTLS